MEKNGKDHLAW